MSKTYPSEQTNSKGEGAAQGPPLRSWSIGAIDASIYNGLYCPQDKYKYKYRYKYKIYL